MYYPKGMGPDRDNNARGLLSLVRSMKRQIDQRGEVDARELDLDGDALMLTIDELNCAFAHRLPSMMPAKFSSTNRIDLEEVLEDVADENVCNCVTAWLCSCPEEDVLQARETFPRIVVEERPKPQNTPQQQCPHLYLPF